MKLALLILLVLVALVVIYFSYLSVRSVKPETGLQQGKLAPCPGTPNCVCSEYQGKFYIDALDTSSMQEPINQAALAVVSLGGKVTEQRQDYLHAEFRSRLFRFADDVELRLDSDNQQLHFRSASREGTSDLGVNRKRVAAIKKHLLASVRQRD